MSMHLFDARPHKTANTDGRENHSAHGKHLPAKTNEVTYVAGSTSVTVRAESIDECMRVIGLLRGSEQRAGMANGIVASIPTPSTILETVSPSAGCALGSAASLAESAHNSTLRRVNLTGEAWERL